MLIIDYKIKANGITITNGLGVTVIKKDHVSQTLCLDAVDWAPGMLFLTVETDQLKKTYKIIKE